MAGCEGELQLTGWTRKRRAVVFRRPIERATAAGGLPLLEQGGVQVQTGPLYESVGLVTNLKENLLTLLLCVVERLIKSGGQTTLRLTSNHAQAPQAQTQLSLFLSGLNNTAEQLAATERWRWIWHRVLTPYRQPAAALLAESG